MDEKTRQEIALHRWAVIAEAANGKLTSSERGAVVRQIAAREHAHPDGTARRYSRGTIDRWLRSWRKGGVDALRPSPRSDTGKVRAMPELFAEAAALRLEMPGRSAAQIASILQYRHGVQVADRTIRGQLRRAGLHRAALKAAPKAYGRYEAERPNERWVTDVLIGPWVPFPKRDGSVRARLFLIVDDHSRLLADGRFFARENARACQELLRRAITRRGIPDILYAEYVPRNIFDILFPAALCAWRRGDAGGPSPAASWQAHNAVSLLKGLPSTRPRRGRYPMLENYFLKPQTVERIRSSWIAPEIEGYVTWLAGHGYSSRCVWRRVPLLIAFAEFTHRRGVRSAADLPAHVDAFVAWRVRQSRQLRHTSRPELAKEIRGPVEHMLGVVLAGYTRRRTRREAPFTGTLPGFFEYLEQERGLQPATIALYRHHLAAFEAWLDRVRAGQLSSLSPALISAFIADRAGSGLSKASVAIACTALRVFLRYAHREGGIASDLSAAVGRPQCYRLADVPRSISWEQVGQMLARVDRRTTVGKRDYAMLLLMATYGLRSREIAALTLDDIDWKRERLAVPARKAGHSTAFPLSQAAGEALIDYLKHGRPQTASRRVFFKAVVPVQPIGPGVVASRARHHLLAAGIQVPRPGSHTLRHSCVQRLVDSGFAWKTIGDFAGHRSPRSTEIYTKVAIGSLRQVAMGDGEEVLSR